MGQDDISFGEESPDDPWRLRDDFLRLKKTEKAALEFLTKIGVWRAVEEPLASEANHGRLLITGAFGHRMFFGRALVMLVDELWKEQEFWKNLLSDEQKLRAQFSGAPDKNAADIKKVRFAMESGDLNTLRLHIDWQVRERKQEGRRRSALEPLGVVEAITLDELLAATTHVDLLRKSKFQICQRPDCAIPFTGRERMYCQWYCGHLQSVRKQRREEEEHGKKR